jgi:hypothetical protein
MRQRFALLGITILSVGMCACGGNTSNSRSSSTSAASSTSAPSAAPAGHGGGASSVSSGPVHGSLQAKNHAPQVDKPWSYAVRVTNAAGQPLSGTVDIQFVFGGQVVGRDTPPTHPVKNGTWHDSLTFPPPAIGMALTFRAVVRTALGSVILDWPVTVHQ